MRWLRLRLWWERAFWVVPLVGIILAAALADLSSELDEAIFAEPGDQLISEAAATTLLAAVGGAMVTFTGFVFSLVLLLLQFGSSQYSPRTVAFFLRARSTQVILGLFLATSLFCFLTLVGVGSEGRDRLLAERERGDRSPAADGEHGRVHRADAPGCPSGSGSTRW